MVSNLKSQNIISQSTPAMLSRAMVMVSNLRNIWKPSVVGSRLGGPQAEGGWREMGGLVKNIKGVGVDRGCS